MELCKTQTNAHFKWSFLNLTYIYKTLLKEPLQKH